MVDYNPRRLPTLMHLRCQLNVYVLATLMCALDSQLLQSFLLVIVAFALLLIVWIQWWSLPRRVKGLLVLLAIHLANVLGNRLMALLDVRRDVVTFMDKFIVFLLLLLDHRYLSGTLNDRANKLIVSELAFLDATVWQHKSTLPMLQALAPLTLVVGAIFPLHLTEAFSEIHPVVALISISALPDKDTRTVLHIIEEVSLILVAIWSTIFPPLTSTVFDPVGEVADIRSPVLPFVAAETVWFTRVVVTSVGVSICEQLSTLAIFQIVFPFTFVPVAILPLMDTVAVNFATTPLSDVGFAVDTLPDAEAVFDTLLPFTIVDFVVRPRENTLSVRLVVQILTNVLRAVREKLIPSAIALIILPLALVHPSIVVDEDAEALALPRKQSASIESILSPFDAKLFRLLDLIIFKELGDHFVLGHLLLFLQVTFSEFRGGL